MSCPDVKVKHTAAQGGSSGAPECSQQRYQSPESAFRAAQRRKRGDDDTRAAVCLEPEMAFRYARDVDHAPCDDTRAAACQEPIYAFRYAMEVDQSPCDATRAGACQDPYWAFRYAQEIDQSPHDMTRAAACKNPSWAYRYARYVDQSVHGDTMSAVMGSDCYQLYLGQLSGQLDELELRIIYGLPYSAEELLTRPDLLAKYGL